MASLPATKKPAIFIKDNIQQAQILAIIALYSHLKKTGTNPEIIINKNHKFISVFAQLLPGIIIKHELEPKKFILKVRKPNADIKTVQWQQDKESLNIFITTEKGDIKASDLNFDVAGSDYDLFILPDVQSLSELGNLHQSFGASFKSNKLFAIGKELNLSDEYQYDSTVKPNLTTLSEQVFAVLEGEQIDQEANQMLFSGILLETNFLRTPIKSNEIFTILKKLADRGAKTTNTKDLVSKLQPVQNEPSQIADEPINKNE